MKCPIASQLPQRAEAPAVSHLSYAAFDMLIRQVATTLSLTTSPIIGCIPRGRVEDIALFFAAWRLGKALYPVSFRYPKSAIEKRMKHVGATLVEPTPSQEAFEGDLLDEMRLATLLETSSGNKIACHTLSAHLHSARSVNQQLATCSHSAYGLILPLFHVAGVAILLRTAIAGGHLLLSDEIQRATHLCAVPTQLYHFVKSQRHFPHLKSLLIGGAPLPPNLKKAPYPIRVSYGMTEAGSTIAIDEKPLAHIEVRVEQGEVFLRGPSMMSHYFGHAPVSGWFPTANVATLQKGALQILGRLDRVFISGGESIQPELIEKALMTIEGISEAHVTPKNDPVYGQVPIATVSGHAICFAEISERLKKHLPRYMIPKEIKWKSLGNSKMGKMSQ